jgi:hypothetical protein
MGSLYKQTKCRLPGLKGGPCTVPGSDAYLEICLASRKRVMCEGCARACRRAAEFLVQRAAEEGRYGAAAPAPASAMPASAAPEPLGAPAAKPAASRLVVRTPFPPSKSGTTCIDVSQVLTVGSGDRVQVCGAAQGRVQTACFYRLCLNDFQHAQRLLERILAWEGFGFR